MKENKSIGELSPMLFDSNSGLITFKQKYIDYLQAQSYSASCIFHKQYQLDFFVHWCNERELFSITQINKDVLLQFRHSISQKNDKKGKPLSNITRYQYFRHIAQFFSWLSQHNFLLVDPAKDIEYKKPPKPLPKQILTSSQIEQLLNSIDITTSMGIRNRAIMETFYSTGIRRSELASLTLDNIEISRNTLMVELGKGKKDRLIPLGERAAKWIEKYLIEVRPDLVQKPQEKTLFLTQYGRAFRPGSLTIYMRNFIKTLGESGSCHIFRHSMSSLMLENGADVRHIQKILGHTNINSTQIYTRVSIPKLKLVHKFAHPANRELSEIPTTKPCDKKPANKMPKEHKTPSISYLPDDSPREDSMTTLFNKHLKWLKLNNFSYSVQKHRKRHISVFIDWCQQRNIGTSHAVSSDIIEKYQRFIHRLENKFGELLAESSRQRYLISLSMFFRWLAQENYLLVNPAKNIRIPNVSKRIPRHILSYKEVETIFSQINLENPLGIRDRAILEILYSTGVRRMELIKLDVKDIHFERETLFVREGKNGKDRLIPIGESALNWAQKYITEIRPCYLVDPKQKALFLSQTGSRLSEITLGTNIRKYFKDADMEKNSGCHIFRHSMASSMLENGADIRYIKEILGHEDLATTQLYTKIDIHKLKQVHELTHPAKIKPTKTNQVLEELE